MCFQSRVTCLQRYKPRVPDQRSVTEDPNGVRVRRAGDGLFEVGTATIVGPGY